MLLVLPIINDSDKIFRFRLSVAMLEGVVAIIVESTNLKQTNSKKSMQTFQGPASPEKTLEI
jgi:hypothetical protein